MYTCTYSVLMSNYMYITVIYLIVSLVFVGIQLPISNLHLREKMRKKDTVIDQ